MSSKLLRSFIIVIISFVCVMVASAQDNTGQITDTTIFYDTPVTDTIAEQAIYDHWRFQGIPGESLLITMTASDGLAPLIGFMDSNRQIIARSDYDLEGNQLPDTEPDSTVELALTIPEAGEYIIIATRLGNADGTTSGSYTLTLSTIDTGSSRENDRVPVEIRCEEAITTIAMQVEFMALDNVDTYRISVYGLDGFEPVIHVSFGSEVATEDCSADSQDMAGDQFVFPGGEVVSLEETLPEGGFPNAAQYSLRGGSLLEQVKIIIGSADDRSGHYVAILEGFVIDENTMSQNNTIEARLGPWSKDSDALVYMVGADRIDPFITMEYIQDDTNNGLSHCDDAARRDCDDVPSLEGAGVSFNDGTQIIGDRFDAGLWLAPGNTDIMLLEFSSLARGAYGNYTVFIFGELPARQ